MKGLPIALALGGICTSAEAQTLEDVRRSLSEGLREAKFASSLAGLTVLGEEVLLSGASYSIDDEVKTRIFTLGLPYSRYSDTFGRSDLGLYTEGAVSFTRATQEVGDIYGGSFPAEATAVDAAWESYTAFVGVGPQLEVNESLQLAVLPFLGVTRFESIAAYEGPGADFTAELLDGIALNWDAWAIDYGVGLRVDWVRTFGERRFLSVVSRYDNRTTSIFEADDAAQEFTSTLKIATLRAEYASPTGLDIGIFPFDYRVSAGLRRITEGSVFGVKEFYEVGARLDFLTNDMVPLMSGLKLSGAAFFGDDLTGWTVSLGLIF